MTAGRDAIAAAGFRLQTVLGRMPPPLSGRLDAFTGGLGEVVGLDAEVGSLVALARPSAPPLEAEVVGFRGGRLLVMPFADAAELHLGARAWRLGGGATAAVGEGLLGRVVDGRGAPADGLGPIALTDRLPLAGRPAPPLERAPVSAVLPTGVRAIDAVAAIGRGQRVGLIAGSGVGKSVLLGMIARSAAADVVVVALVGERGREVADFLERKLPQARRGHAVIVATPADHAPVLRIRAALRATAIAEYFRDRGQSVLLLFDSLTRAAQAQRELGLSLGEPASARGYPPSALALIGRLVERAGGARSTGGAITAVYTVLADGDDEDDPVVDAARSILDGHIVLDRALAERGQYPAVNPARSLSRCFAEIASAEHLASARLLCRHFATYEANRDLFAMGAWKPGQDAALDAAVAAYPEVTGYLAQAPDEAAEFAATVSALIARFPA